MTAFRSLFARATMKVALIISPLVFIGAECDPTGPGAEPLAMNAMRATVSQEGAFFSSGVLASDQGSFWRLEASGGGVNDDRAIELDIPKQTSVPYTVNVSTDSKGVIFYCVPITPGSSTCKNFFADKAHGGSGTITVTHTDGYLEGTFNGTVKLSNENETRTISSGEFKAKP